MTPTEDEVRKAEEIVRQIPADCNDDYTEVTRKIIANALAEQRENLQKEIFDLANNENGRLTVHILRTWEVKTIERFALHLLGDKWQSLESANSALEERVKELERDYELRGKYLSNANHNFYLAEKEIYHLKAENERLRNSKKQGGVG